MKQKRKEEEKKGEGEKMGKMDRGSRKGIGRGKEGRGGMTKLERESRKGRKGKRRGGGK